MRDLAKGARRDRHGPCQTPVLGKIGDSCQLGGKATKIHH